MRKLHLTGQRFGNLVAIKPVPHGEKAHNVHWLCQCDCGAKLIVRSDNLKLGHSTRCSQCSRNGRTVGSIFVKDVMDDGVV